MHVAEDELDGIFWLTFDRQKAPLIDVPVLGCLPRQSFGLRAFPSNPFYRPIPAIQSRIRNMLVLKNKWRQTTGKNPEQPADPIDQPRLVVAHFMVGQNHPSPDPC